MGRDPVWAADPEKSRIREEKAVAAAKDRQVRLRSNATDTLLNFPVSVPNPGAGDLPRRSPRHVANYNPHSEVQRSTVQGPPNKSIFNIPDWDQRPPSSVPEDTKLFSSGQLSSCFKWNASSRKSHKNTSRGQLQRQSHPSNTKNVGSSTLALLTSSPPSRSSGKHKTSVVSSPSSTCSSASSSTSSYAGLGFATSPINTPKKSASSGGTQSFTEKLQTVFSHQSVTGSVRTSPNNNSPSSSSGVFSRLREEARHRSRSNSKGNREDTKPPTASSSNHSDYSETETSNPSLLQIKSTTTKAVYVDNSRTRKKGEQPPEILSVMVARNNPNIGAANVGVTAMASSKVFQSTSTTSSAPAPNVVAEECWDNYVFEEDSIAPCMPLSSSALGSEIVSENNCSNSNSSSSNNKCFNNSSSININNHQQWLTCSPNNSLLEGQVLLQTSSSSSDCLRKKSTSTSDNKNNTNYTTTTNTSNRMDGVSSSSLLSSSPLLLQNSNSNSVSSSSDDDCSNSTSSSSNSNNLISSTVVNNSSNNINKPNPTSDNDNDDMDTQRRESNEEFPFMNT